MTDITARLAALGVEVPEVERVLIPHVSTAHSLPGTCLPAIGEPSRDEWLAALAAVVDLLEDAKDQRMQLKADIDTLKGLLEQAEAERDEWKALHDGWIRVCNQHDQINADAAQDLERTVDGLYDRAERAEAEAARLRVCGTCGHRGYSVAAMTYRCGEDGSPKHITDPCHFDPPRWTPY
jgi:hypothetical protein